MINHKIQNIVKQYSGKYSDGFIKFDLYSKLDKRTLDFLRLNLNLGEEYLQFINCPQCDKELKIRVKDDQRYINCFSAGCGIKREFKNNEDLAYKITLTGIADFLINLLEIKEDKKNLISGKLIKLGKKEIFDLNFDIFLLKEKLSSQEILNSCKPTSNKIPSILIKLTDKNLEINQSNIGVCCFSDLILYDENLNKFGFNHQTLIEIIKGCYDGLQKTTTQKWLDNKCLEWFKELIKNNSIKHGEKEKFKKIANDLFGVSPNKYNEIWKSHATNELKSQGLK